MTWISLTKWSKAESLSPKHFKKDLKQREVENYFICKNVLQKPGGGENCRGLRIEPGQW
jgi:hypothetical protein